MLCVLCVLCSLACRFSNGAAITSKLTGVDICITGNARVAPKFADCSIVRSAARTLYPEADIGVPVAGGYSGAGNCGAGSWH